jgi:hypothetical protein
MANSGAFDGIAEIAADFIDFAGMTISAIRPVLDPLAAGRIPVAATAPHAARE